MEVNNIEELVTNATLDLQTLADSGNSVAREWLVKLQPETSAMKILSMFGEMRISLMQDGRPEARVVGREMFPE
jgi:hypothetical protein